MNPLGQRQKRRRVSKKRVHHEPLDRDEERMIHIALANSKTETKRRQGTLPSARVFYPTEEEFRYPIIYINRIQEEAQKTGICKVVPPPGWKPDLALDLNDTSKTFSTHLQHIHKLQEGKYYEDGDDHTLKSYRRAAHKHYKKWMKKKGWSEFDMTSLAIEKEYWNIVETQSEEVGVEYANDLDTTTIGSGFHLPTQVHADLFQDDPIDLAKEMEYASLNDQSYYAKTGWNLNNLPQWPGSLLRHIRTPINGVNVPWLYCGMLFATFCWHAEDNYLYSINYMHHGAKKRWYGVPATRADAFEKVMKQKLPLRFREEPDLLFHLVTMLSPSTLVSNNVEVYSLLQEPGDIIITYPQAFHCGYSEGFNINEAVNFALPNWLQFGRACTEKYRQHGRMSVFSHDRLLCILQHTNEIVSIEWCQVLLREFQDIYAEEVEMRNQKDLVYTVKMAPNTYRFDERTMQEDDQRQCCVCKHSCHFSGIVCPCSSTKIACLRHAKALCGSACDMKNKYLLEWVSLEELECMTRRLEEALQERMQALRKAQWSKSSSL